MQIIFFIAINNAVTIYRDIFNFFLLYYVYLRGVVFVLYRNKEFFLGYLLTRKAILRSVFM